MNMSASRRVLRFSREAITLQVSCALLVGCGANASPPAVSSPPSVASVTQPPPAPAKPTVNVTLESVGLDPLAIDRSQDPCTDFYQYACGNWLKAVQIPADEPAWSRSFNEINKRNELALKGILEQATKATAPDPVTKKLATFYGACMNEAASNQAGARPIEPLLRRARSVTNAKS